MKSKLKGAQVGHDLLKRKSEALTKRFRDITKRIDEAKRKMGRVMQIAAFSLAEVTYAVGNNTIGYQITESVRQAKFRVRTKQENVSGVFLPQFESFQMEGGSDFQMTGLGKGGQQVAKCRETYTRAVETLVELASLQTAFVILDEVIKVVNRRVNAMYVSCGMVAFDEALLTRGNSEHVIIPRTENTIKYINGELDEMDREEFFRLKKVKGVKEKAQAAEEAERRKKIQQEKESNNENKNEEPALQEETKNVLGDEGDEDLIF
jgi:V-type H+-transporting ATPase subunit D